MLRSFRHAVFPLLILLVAATALPGCARQAARDTQAFPRENLPPQVQAAPAVVQETYQFAASSPDLMQAIPCYCGCGSIGHTSNYSCYVAGQNQDGSLRFDDHALGCSICVDITQDARRLQKQGKSPAQIRAYIDDTYGKYGTSNMPPE
ncbi:MAG: PCYCGC motif-containing (lipo)protein [Bacteroidota bacterium]